MSIIADMHIHSTFSPDASDEIDIMCSSAIEKGLKYICFTEHLDLNPVDEAFGYFDFENYSKTIEKAREKYGHKIEILKGLEFSEPHLYSAEFEKITNMDFDVIVVGIHWYDDLFYGDKRLQERYTKEEIYNRYYQDVLLSVKHGGFDVLAHLDFIKRYVKGQPIAPAIIDDILKELIKKDIALEINTSSIRRGLSECTPDLDILQKYIIYGGEKITIGSDAHSLEEIAADFDCAYELIRSNGLDCVPGIYKKRKFYQI